MDYKLTTSILEGWLRRKEYRCPYFRMTASEMADSGYIQMERCNRVLGRSFHHTFEKWFKGYKRIPTPNEFVALQMMDIEKKFNTPSWKSSHKISFNLTPIVKKGMKNRLLRSYKSFINELHTKCLIKELYPKLEIESNGNLDYEGIDILAINNKKGYSHKIHITRASEYAIDFLFKKEGKRLEFRGYDGCVFAKPVWEKISHSIYQQRDFRGHTFFLYSEQSNNSDVRVVNGYPLFTKQYIVTKIEADNIRFSKAG